MIKIIIQMIKGVIMGLLSLFSKPKPVQTSAQPVATPAQPVPVQPVEPVVPISNPVVTIGLDYQLSPHFTFGTVTKTDHREWIDKNREEARTYIEMLSRLCIEVLEPVYTLMGSLYVTSCFRCKGLNGAIGGSATSQHCDGEACDMEFQGATEGALLRAAFNKIAFSNIIYSQCIYEFEQWVHIALLDEKLHPGKKLQKLVAASVKQPNGKSKTVYTAVTSPI
jgi:hypothetical protein